ncbi:MAG: multiheme c-type cytochrome [Planctomycetota bacterium]
MAWLLRPLPGTAATGEEPDPAAQTCAECHAERQPGLMAQWDASEHARQGVACEECHGDDHDEIFAEKGRVPAMRCQGCHAQETIEFRQSVHGRALTDRGATAAPLTIASTVAPPLSPSHRPRAWAARIPPRSGRRRSGRPAGPANR